MKAFFTTVVMLYLALDLGNPLLPGANSFLVEDSVEVVQLQREPTPSPPSLAVTPEPLLRLAPVRLSPQRVGRQVRPGPGMAAPLHAVRHLSPDPSPEAAR